LTELLSHIPVPVVLYHALQQFMVKLASYCTLFSSTLHKYEFIETDLFAVQCLLNI